MRVAHLAGHAVTYGPAYVCVVLYIKKLDIERFGVGLAHTHPIIVIAGTHYIAWWHFMQPY